MCGALVDPTSIDTLMFRKNLGQRIAQCVAIIGKKGESAAIAGVTAEQLNKWINGTVKVPVEALRLLAAAADSDFSWLATGDGDPRHARPIQIRRENAPTDASGVRSFEVDDLDQLRMVTIPLYGDVRPSAGPGRAVTSETPTTRVAFERRWLADIGVQTDTAVILPAQGDSMEPTIMNGSPMLVDTSKREILNGYIYAIAVENDLLVKRIRRRLDGRIDLISDNPAYDPETLDAAALQQLRVIGRVYAAVSRF